MRLFSFYPEQRSTSGKFRHKNDEPYIYIHLHVYICLSEQSLAEEEYQQVGCWSPGGTNGFKLGGQIIAVQRTDLRPPAQKSVYAINILAGASIQQQAKLPSSFNSRLSYRLQAHNELYTLSQTAQKRNSNMLAVSIILYYSILHIDIILRI